MLKSDPWNKLARKESRLFSKQIFMKQKGELYVDKMNLFLFQMPERVKKEEDITASPRHCPPTVRGWAQLSSVMPMGADTKTAE